jgi:hypothetical protein
VFLGTYKNDIDAITGIYKLPDFNTTNNWRKEPAMTTAFFQLIISFFVDSLRGVSANP